MVLTASTILCLSTCLIVSSCVRLDTKYTSKIRTCKISKKGSSLNIQDLVGTWMKIYSQPIAAECVILKIRATTDLEREQFSKFGNLNGHVDWDKCLLQVESPYTSGKHFLQGDGKNSGVLKNIIIFEDKKGDVIFREETEDQWTVFGRRGSELLLIRECAGESRVAFARAPYWPSAADLYAVLHRAGVAPLAQGRGHVQCDPQQFLTDLLANRDRFTSG